MKCVQPRAKTWGDKLRQLEVYINVIAFTIMVGAIFLSVVNRVAFKISMAWPEEVARYAMIWMTFLSMSIGFRKGSHVGVEAVVLHLPGPLKKAALCLASLLTVLFCAGGAYFALQIVLTQMATNQLTPALGIPMAVPYLAIPVGLAISVLEEGLHLYEKLAAQ